MTPVSDNIDINEAHNYKNLNEDNSISKIETQPNTTSLKSPPLDIGLKNIVTEQLIDHPKNDESQITKISIPPTETLQPLKSEIIMQKNTPMKEKPQYIEKNVNNNVSEYLNIQLPSNETKIISINDKKIKKNNRKLKKILGHTGFDINYNDFKLNPSLIRKQLLSSESDKYKI